MRGPRSFGTVHGSDRRIPAVPPEQRDETSVVKGLVELTLEVGDLRLGEAFYAGVLGLTILDRQADRVWLAVDSETRLGLWCPGEKEFGDQGGRHVHFAFSVEADRLPPLAGRVREAGIGVRGPVAHPGGDRSIYFKDPFGNLVEAWDLLDRGRDLPDRT
jgi:catechol-2,3-dioxygenase